MTSRVELVLLGSLAAVFVGGLGLMHVGRRILR